MEELEDVKQFLPANADVSDIRFEGSDIVIYTDSRDFFLNNSDTVKEIVSELKKRVEIRPSSKLFKEPESAKKTLEDIIDDDAGVEDLIFQPSLGKVIVRAEKPGAVIGNRGSGLEEIKEKTLWAPQVERVPSIQSKVVDRARELTVEDPEFRKDFLHDVGQKIRLDKAKDDQWIRVSGLGGCRQVGRSCFLLQTEESNVLLDCGLDPSAEPGSQDNFPYLNAPELDLQQLDAVVLSHAHADHCLTPDTPVTMADGSRKPIAQVEEGDELMSFNWSSGEIEKGKCQKKKKVADEEYIRIETDFNSIRASGDHRFFTMEDLEVVEKEASDLEEGDFIPKNSVNRDIGLVELDDPEYRERIDLTQDAKDKIRQFRETEDLSQKKLSEKAGMGVNFVHQLENEYESVYLPGLENLTRAMNKDLDEFLEKNGMERTEYPDLNREMAKFLGYFYGDGHRDGNSLVITDKNKACLKNYSELVEKIFNYKPKIMDHTDKSKNAFRLMIHNAGIVKFVEKNFEGIFRSSTEGYVPKKIKYGSEEAVKGFLEGLFDAEGSVNGNISISQANKEFLYDLQNLFSSTGIQASVSNRATPSVDISRQEEVANFNSKLDPLHPSKIEDLEKLDELNQGESPELMPVTNKEFHTILEETGLKGQVHGSNNYADLPTCLVDWYRRDEESAATRETIQELKAVLEEHLEGLRALESSEVKECRRKISITRKELVEVSQTNLGQVQTVEDRSYSAGERDKVLEGVRKLIQAKVEITEEVIESLESLLEMDAEWHRITKKTQKQNDYGYLVDLKISPHENFIANDQIVHNCSMIPYLYKMGYDGPLYCTKPTRDLMIMNTLDYIGIAHKEQNSAPYDSSAIKKAVKRTITPDLGEVTDITPDIRLTLKNAGHVLGSALVHLHVGEGLHNLLYTGDYNYDQSEMLRPADTNFRRVETMITESTYGGRNDKHQPREEAQKKFLSKMKQTLNKGGKVIVPVFALGRSQEIIGMLADELDREYFDYPVYMDGMINDANALHTAYPEFLSEKVQDKIIKEDNSPFLKENLNPIASHNERKDVFDEGPCVILTTSGMVTGGPVMSYLQKMASTEKNAMIFVGYQAEGTLGRKIQNGVDKIEVNGQEVEVNLNVSTVSGFSAHSDKQQIINFSKNLRSTPNRVLTNHGEEKKCFQLASTLHKVLHIDTSAPMNLDVSRLN